MKTLELNQYSIRFIRFVLRNYYYNQTMMEKEQITINQLEKQLKGSNHDVLPKITNDIKLAKNGYSPEEVKIITEIMFRQDTVQEYRNQIFVVDQFVSRSKEKLDEIDYRFLVSYIHGDTNKKLEKAFKVQEKNVARKVDSLIIKTLKK